MVSTTNNSTRLSATNGLNRSGETRMLDDKVAKERAAALERTKSQIERTFGKGSLMTMDENALAAIPGISTGAVSLDHALGGKGLPVGRGI
jgi:recombination protein RecA